MGIGSELRASGGEKNHAKSQSRVLNYQQKMPTGSLFPNRGGDHAGAGNHACASEVKSDCVVV